MLKAEDVRFIHQAQKDLRKVQAQRTKRQNEKQDLYIQEDIMNYFRQGDIPLLDRMSPVQQPKTKFQQMIQNKHTSAITFTFKAELRDNNNELQLRQYLYKTLKTIVLNREMSIEVLLIPDCDESGNFHYHGLVVLPIKYRPSFKRLVTKYIGYMKYAYITEPDKWEEYCFKDIYNNSEIEHLTISLKL